MYCSFNLSTVFLQVKCGFRMRVLMCTSRWKRQQLIRWRICPLAVLRDHRARSKKNDAVVSVVERIKALRRLSRTLLSTCRLLSRKDVQNRTGPWALSQPTSGLKRWMNPTTGLERLYSVWVRALFSPPTAVTHVCLNYASPHTCSRSM